jgi:hypothetical protein
VPAFRKNAEKNMAKPANNQIADGAQSEVQTASGSADRLPTKNSEEK